MASTNIAFSVFTKPWKMPLPGLGKLVRDLGFDGIELPVRTGFQVEPERAATNLPAAVRALAKYGVRITSVASTPTEALIATCAEYGIPIIRTMAEVRPGNYMADVAALQKGYERLLPVLEQHQVTLGIQNHYGKFVCNAMGLRHLLAPFDSPFIGAIWDPAHDALCGEEPELALEILWPYLRLVNLKNAYWQRKTKPEAMDVEWEVYWASGPQGLASWPRVVAALRQRGYSGIVCLPAEYTDESSVEQLAAADLRYAKSLFAA